MNTEIKVDFTNGEKANYMVNLYIWDEESGMLSKGYHMYYHSFAEAKSKFKELSDQPMGSNTVISVYDMHKDIRKLFKKF